MIGASRVSDDNYGKNDGMKWKQAAPFHYSIIIGTRHSQMTDTEIRNMCRDKMYRETET